MTLVHCALYGDGRLLAEPGSIAACARRREEARDQAGFTWIALRSPDESELALLQEQFGLHDMAVEDSLVAHQRAKVERYEHLLFTVLRPGAYDDAQEEIRFGEIHIFLGPDFAITIQYAASPGVEKARQRLSEEPELLAHGPAAVHYAVLDRVVDDYYPILDGVSTDLDQIEDDLFAGQPRVAPRIYSLARQVTGFHRAVEPLSEMIAQAARSELVRSDEELRHRLRDVGDHTLTVTHRVESLRAALNDAMQLDSTLTAGRQNEAAMQLNEQTKRISSWAAILVAPTLIAGIYGMNFEEMPELQWAMGYPYSLGLMLLVCLALYIAFKRKDWL